MVGSIEPFIKGLYNVAPKCKECGDMREYWDDELCIKCRKKKENEEMIDFKPCPFCGGTDIHIVENGPDGFSITCKDCNAWVDNIFEDMTEEQAIELWNKRVTE